MTDVRAERFVDTTFAGGKNRLCVDAELTGSVTLGAVKIEDGNSGLVADVELCTDGSRNGLVVIPCEPVRGKVNIFGSSVVAVDATFTLATYVVPVGKKFYFTGGVVGGTANGEFLFQVGGITQALIRNSGSNRTVIADFPAEPEASASATVEIKVKNIDNKPRTFEATISGYTIDA